MRVYEDAKELVEREIEDIVKKDEMSPTELDILDKLVDISKDICEMEQMKSGGYSGRSSYGVMPYYGMIGYEDASYGRGGNRSGANYNQGNYAQGGNSGRNYAGNNSGRNSYGRGYDDMMPNRQIDW